MLFFDQVFNSNYKHKVPLRKGGGERISVVAFLQGELVSRDVQDIASTIITDLIGQLTCHLGN